MAIDWSNPEVDITQVDYEPQFELGTRYIEYINGIRHVYRYVKIVGGVVGENNNGKEELRYNYHRWI